MLKTTTLFTLIRVSAGNVILLVNEYLFGFFDRLCSTYLLNTINVRVNYGFGPSKSRPHYCHIIYTIIFLCMNLFGPPGYVRPPQVLIIMLCCFFLRFDVYYISKEQVQICV